MLFKRVAVVENFYDIIYNVHVEMDGRSGKHAGQKRTYRAVSGRRCSRASPSCPSVPGQLVVFHDQLAVGLRCVLRG